jgi:hypothetical protein
VEVAVGVGVGAEVAVWVGVAGGGGLGVGLAVGAWVGVWAGAEVGVGVGEGSGVGDGGLGRQPAASHPTAQAPAAWRKLRRERVLRRERGIITFSLLDPLSRQLVHKVSCPLYKGSYLR